MPLKRHHKIIIRGLSFIVIIFMILTSVFTYILFVRQTINYQLLNQEIEDLKIDTQTKINELSKTSIKIEKELKALGSQIGSIDEQISLLKASTSEDFSGIIEEVVKSVVTIRTDFSQGTGFIIDEEGYVVTNAHIMEGAEAAGIITYNGDLHQVRLIGKNELMDIILLKIETEDIYEVLEFANSDNVQVGEKVIAIGNPLGLQFSVTEGIVSAVHREGINEIEAYIQTDAALNPGNSGGPLINKQGKVVGINNFKIGGSESLGFALESNYVENAINDISMEILKERLI